MANLKVLEIPILVGFEFGLNDIPTHRSLDDIEIVRDIMLRNWILEEIVSVRPFISISQGREY